MVNYAEDADYADRKKPRKYRSPEEIRRRTDARNAARSEEDWERYARDIVYRQLGMRDKSTHELRQALARRSVPDSIVEQTIHSFVESGLVNDAAFAEAFVRSRFAGKPSSHRSLALELKKRGISSEDADAALAQIDPDDERCAAIDLAVRKAQAMHSLTRDVARRRLYGMLARRGFSPSDISEALRIALDSMEEID